jgi:putative aldouronate transport system permease protein
MRRAKSLHDDLALWIMLIPVIAYLVLFRYIPISGVLISLKRFSPFLGFWKSPWNGLEYFRQFFSSIYFERVLRNTLILGAYYLVFAFPMPVFLALMLNSVRRPRLKKIFQTVTLLPHFVSFVVIAGIAINLLSPSTGVVNLFRQAIGLEPVFFMQKQELFPFIYTFIRIFK